MEVKLPKYIEQKLWRTIAEFEMIKPNDKILIGLSGGKDSLFLCYVLSNLSRYSAFPFKVAALTIDPGFKQELNMNPIEEFCKRLEIPFFIEKTELGNVVKSESTKNPCSTCAYFRRGIINKFASEKGYKIIALAHHLDDIIETFILNILYSGTLETMQPKIYQDRTKITLIRPLAYFKEKEIMEAKVLHGITPISMGCPYSGNTKRDKVKNMLNDLKRDDPGIYSKILAAMRQGPHVKLWPEKLSRNQIWEKHQNLWNMIK